MSNDPTSKVAQTFQSSTVGMQPSTRGAKKYPWETMLVGESFRVFPKDMKLSTLKPYAYRMGKRLGKKFKVVNWGEGFEVCRQPMTENEIIAVSKTVMQANDRVNEQPKSALFEALDKMKEIK